MPAEEVRADAQRLTLLPYFAAIWFEAFARQKDAVLTAGVDDMALLTALVETRMMLRDDF